MLIEGLNIIRDLLDGDIDTMMFGTGTTEETAIDTGLETPDTSTELTATGTATSQMLTEQGTMNSLIGVGVDLTEVAVRRSTAPITDYSHTTFSAVSKTNLIEVRTRTRFWFE